MSDPFSGATTPVVDDNVDFMAELVGEGKKYKSDKDLAKGAWHANQHISQLERQLAEMREDLTKRTAQDDILTEVRRLQQSNGQSQQNTPPVDTQTQQTSGLTKEEVAQMFAEREAEQTRNNNLTSAISKLTELYGNDVAVEIQRKADELRVSRDQLRDMAKNTPQVFTALFQPRESNKDVFAAPPGSSRNPIANTQNSVLGKYSDHQKVRATDPKKYYSPAYQKLILQQADRAAAISEAKYNEWRNS